MTITDAIKKHQTVFGLDLTDEKIAELGAFYDLVMKHNELLHLVGPCDAEEFAVRHILESLYALRFLPENTVFADIGTGAGLPAVPCLIVREDLLGKLIESKEKKGKFLETVIHQCNLSQRALLINKQFQEISNIEVSYVLCRALDKFGKRIPQIKKWSDDARLILFAGNAVRQELAKKKIPFEEFLIPLSERRYLFVTEN
jgi:16S rRNA (guanine527-N7)-methyltransferase